MYTRRCVSRFLETSSNNTITKKSSPQSLSDLRPISLLPVLSKVFEKILSSQLVKHLNNYNILPPFQSGFRSGHSCETALLKISDDILSASDNGLATVLVLLDFTKAFDTVDHNLLGAIFHYVGLGTNAVKLLAGFLQSRSQSVKLEGDVSARVYLNSGVPQGSILAPLFFSIYTCALFDPVQRCSVHMYADDTQLYLSFPRDTSALSLNAFQQDLDTVFDVCSQHNLRINSAKSAVLFFGSQQMREHLTSICSLHIGGEILPIVSAARSLGIIMDSTFRYRKQISNYIQRAYCNLKILYQHRSYLSINLKLLLCNSLVLSPFTYCSTMYGPCTDVNDQKRIQRVQNSCLRFAFNVRRHHHISHTLRLCNWLNMRNRMILKAACMYHVVIINKAPGYLYDKISFRTDVHNINIRSRGLITPPLHKTCLYERSFSYNVYKIYNAVPDGFKKMSLGKFKNSLRQYIYAKQIAGESFS